MTKVNRVSCQKAIQGLCVYVQKDTTFQHTIIVDIDVKNIQTCGEFL